MSDNGPMYDYFPSAGYSWLRGQKGEVYEGGIRVPAIAYWPGMIEAQQDPIDMIHVVDWYTTAARIAGNLEAIPDDRVLDGVDQLALLLFGEDNGRRNYMYHYDRGSDPSTWRNGMELGAIRYGDIKRHVNKGETYNILRDPAEKNRKRGAYIWSAVPFSQMALKHYELIDLYPNRVLDESSEPPKLDVIRSEK
jgi:arylsulfatase